MPPAPIVRPVRRNGTLQCIQQSPCDLEILLIAGGMEGNKQFV